MKKFISMAIASVMFTLNCVGVSAAEEATVSINTAKYNAETKLVNVTGNVKNPVNSQILTIMSTGITQSSSADLDKIVYIDQRDDVSFDENGNFSLSFALSSEVVDGKSYFVCIGGNDISSPAYMAFNFNSDGEAVILFGDVNDDGIVDVTDADVLLKYVRDSSSVEISENGFKNAQINATPTTEFTAQEAAMIFEKANNSKYLFPAELK